MERTLLQRPIQMSMAIYDLRKYRLPDVDAPKVNVIFLERPPGLIERCIWIEKTGEDR